MSYFAKRTGFGDAITSPSQLEPPEIDFDADGSADPCISAGRCGPSLTHEGTHATENSTGSGGLFQAAKDLAHNIANGGGDSGRTLLIGAAIIGGLYFLTRKKRR